MLKTVSSFVNVIGALNYKGTWNASTNVNPTLVSGVGTKGDYYVVSVAGNTNIDGQTLWGVGDWIVFNGTVWQRVDGGSTGNFTTVDASSTITGASLIPSGSSVPTNGMYLPAANAVGLASNSNMRVYITSAGNVGINTSTPAALLETRKDTNATVNELIRLRNDGTGNGGGVSINFTQETTSTGYVRNWYSGSWRTDIASYQHITFSVGASPVEVARITENGNVQAAAGSTGMTNGFFYIPAAAGVPTGVPTAISGRVPMYYDSTNNDFYIYNGGWKKVLLS